MSLISAELEDLLICPVCFEMFNDPLSLFCLHTLCKECFQQLTHGNMIDCPKCREQSSIQLVKKDFKTKALMDIYYKQRQISRQPTVNPAGVMVCGMCANIHVAVSHRCVHCDILLCTACEELHGKLKLSSMHTVKPVKVMVKSVQSNLAEMVKVIQQENSVLQDKTQALSTIISESEVNQAAAVDVYIDNMVKNLQSRRQHLHSMIQDGSTQLVKKLEDQQKIFDSKEVELNARITYIQGLLRADDIPILKNKYKLKKFCSYSQDHIIQEMCLLNGELWCIISDAIVVYNSQNLKKIKDIKLDTQTALGMCQTNLGDLIIASSSDGLHRLFPCGKYNSTISKGNYSSVCSYDNKLFALEYEECKLIILMYYNSKWKESSEIELHHVKGSPCDRISIHEDKIYVSSCYKDCLYVFDLNGQILYETGSHGSGIPGHLFFPRVCSVDSAGGALVCDRLNNRLQVCDKRGQWHVLDLPIRIKSPWHAVLNQQADALWVSTQDNHIYKFDNIKIASDIWENRALFVKIIFGVVLIIMVMFLSNFYFAEEGTETWIKYIMDRFFTFVLNCDITAV